MVDFSVAIHGGAGIISKDVDNGPYYRSLVTILTDTFNFIRNVAENRHELTAVDIVEYAVVQLENDPLFNAGRGSVYTSEGTHEMEASIMDGSNNNVSKT